MQDDVADALRWAQQQGYCHGSRSADIASLPHGPRRSLQTLITLLHQAFGVTLCTTITANDCQLDTA